MPLDVNVSGSVWADAKNVSVWNGSSWVQSKKIKVWNGSNWVLSWVPIIPTIALSFSKSPVTVGEAYDVTVSFSIPAPEGTIVTVAVGTYSANLYPAEGASSVTLPGASHAAAGSHVWSAVAVTMGGTTTAPTKAQTANPSGIPVDPPNTSAPITFSERYSFSNSTTSIYQHCPVYLGVEPGVSLAVVEFLYSKDGGVSWAAFDRKARTSANPDAGYGGWAKMCVFPDAVGTWQIKARWWDGATTRTTNAFTLSVLGIGAQFKAKIEALIARINNGPALYFREYGYVAPNGANDGDTFDWQPTTANYSTKTSLGYELGPDGNGAYRPAGSTAVVANRYLGVQAPEFSESSGKDWQWGKSAWRRNVEFVPLGQKIRMKSMNASGKGYDSSRGDGNFRTCRSVWVDDCNVDVCDLLVDEGLAKSYTQRDEPEIARANANLARMERASICGIGLFRGTDPECGKWSVTFNSNTIRLWNISAGNNRDVGDWHVMDAAGVSNHYQIKDAPGMGSTIVNQGGYLDISMSGLDNAPKIETASVHTNQPDNEPDELICWAARREGENQDGVPMEMAISRTT